MLDGAGKCGGGLGEARLVGGGAIIMEIFAGLLGSLILDRHPAIRGPLAPPPTGSCSVICGDIGCQPPRCKSGVLPDGTSIFVDVGQDRKEKADR